VRGLATLTCPHPQINLVYSHFPSSLSHDPTLGINSDTDAIDYSEPDRTLACSCVCMLSQCRALLTRYLLLVRVQPTTSCGSG